MPHVSLLRPGHAAAKPGCLDFEKLRRDAAANSPRSLFFTGLLAAALLLTPNAAPAQGCSQCRDNVAQSSPEVQHGYREAILLMLTASVTLFSAALIVIRKNR